MSITAELIEKALTTGDLTDGGRLNPEQQAQFIRFVKKFSTLLGEIRVERMRNLRKDVDKIWINQPITQAVGQDSSAGTKAEPKFNKITLNAVKVKSFWDVTTETFQDNIEQDDLEMAIQNMFMEQLSTDIENLTLNGDSSLGGGTPTEDLLKTLDGILKQAENGHVVDFGGKTISKHIFAVMRRRMPKQYIDRNLRYFVSDGVMTDWMDLLSDRGTIVGDRALQGEGISPYGHAVTALEVMPDDLSITVQSSTPATVVATNFGPYKIEAGVNDKVKFDIDNAGAVEITLPSGTLAASVIAAFINAADPSFAGIARDDREGRLLLQSTTTGAASEVDIQAPSGASAYTTLGLTVAVTNGAAAGGSGTVLEGSRILLAHPRNFILGIMDGTRIYNKFNEQNDRLETTVYNQLDVKIEETDAVVFGTDLRLRGLV